ncbi:MAG TPA: hypothetical protein VFU22_03340, partial [Roseiflexaceae bacterium]|nr:hypothetical protein [Roseiflexaceae bacterium]
MKNTPMGDEAARFSGTQAHALRLCTLAGVAIALIGCGIAPAGATTSALTPAPTGVVAASTSAPAPSATARPSIPPPSPSPEPTTKPTPI